MNDLQIAIEQSNLQIQRYTRISIFLIFIGILLFIWEIIFFFLTPNSFSDSSLNSLGDTIAGTVGPIWSLASFFVVYIAFLGQKQQILHQQMEIKQNTLELQLTRKEIISQNLEMVQQNKHLALQRIETTFFNLLNHHANTVKDLHFYSQRAHKDYRGRETFQSKYNQIMDLLNKNIPLVKESATQFIIEENKIFGHYFRGLYHILKYIDSSTDPDSKYKYTSILRASIDSYEYLLLFVYGISNYGFDYFRPLVEKYSLFKGFDQTLLTGVNPTDFYDEVAFFTNSQRRENGLDI